MSPVAVGQSPSCLFIVTKRTFLFCYNQVQKSKFQILLFKNFQKESIKSVVQGILPFMALVLVYFWCQPSVMPKMGNKGKMSGGEMLGNF